MSPQIIAHYDAPHQFEPLLPDELRLRPLLEQASDVMRAATALGSATTAQQELKSLLRAMNSYYTNKLEGEHTRPIEIERALQQDFSANADIARRQRLAVAHIKTEQQCEDDLDAQAAKGTDAFRALYSIECVKWLHRELFSGLADADLRVADGTSLVAGEFRARQVAVGRHEPPLSKSLPAFLNRWSEVYGGVRRGEMSLVAAVASHHRLAWVHPFLDGNGRVARLHTHLVLHAMGLTNGLWSPLRGFARSESKYKALLQAADEHRQGDLDGRGNLTQKGFVEWIAYALDVCRDQIEFMTGQLEVRGMQGRIEASLIHDAATGRNGIRTEALRPLHYLFAAQVELTRGEFKTMSGLGDRLATDLVSALLKSGYVASDSPYGKLRFAIPRHALRHYFPNLWPEAEADREMSKS
ncbi:Fic family protein [Ramlibacter sp.]|uniref:Fic family protein n=1 Tax=Ramlibacter sp. TaxID=1917967 RepID=UPI003D129C6F